MWLFYVRFSVYFFFCKIVEPFNWILFIIWWKMMAFCGKTTYFLFDRIILVFFKIASKFCTTSCSVLWLNFYPIGFDFFVFFVKIHRATAGWSFFWIKRMAKYVVTIHFICLFGKFSFSNFFEMFYKTCSLPNNPIYHSKVQDTRRFQSAQYFLIPSFLSWLPATYMQNLPSLDNGKQELDQETMA